MSRIITSIAAPITTNQRPSTTALRSAVFPLAGPSPGPRTLLNFNPFRLGAILINNSPTATLYIALESLLSPPTVSPTSYTVSLPPMGEFIMSFPSFLGRIDGYWSPVAVGDNVQVTELT